MENYDLLNKFLRTLLQQYAWRRSRDTCAQQFSFNYHCDTKLH